MSTQKLIILVVLVAIAGTAAYWYLNNLNHEEDSPAEVEKSEQSEKDPVTSTDSSTQADVAATVSQTSSTDTDNQSEDLDSILSGFDNEGATYDDSRVDDSLSGNLDQGI